MLPPITTHLQKLLTSTAMYWMNHDISMAMKISSSVSLLKIVKRGDAGCSQRESDLLPLEYNHLILNAVTDCFIIMQLFKNRNTTFKVSDKCCYFKYLWKEKMKQSVCEEKKLYNFSKSKPAYLFRNVLIYSEKNRDETF